VIKDLSIAWDDVEGVGWTKMRTLIPILKEQGLVGDWFDIAKNYSVKELEILVKDAKLGFDITAVGGERIVTLTFNMTPEQSEIITEALDSAKKVSETTDNVLALEQMAYDYVMGQGEVEKVSLEALIKFAEKAYGVQLGVMDREDVSEMMEDEQHENAVGKVQG
jgi:hypothetical protein